MRWIKNHWWDYIFLLLLLIASMWQVSFLQATMKWDIMDITLPWNYYISECLSNGELPLWNPFLNGGFAQMGINDTWNPINWLIGYLFGYDPTVIQLQYVGHLYFAGIGFYLLGKFLGWSRTTRLVIASAYMLSGFMIGNAQHLGWIIGASWLPWVFLYFKKWEKEPTTFTAILLAVITALMFLGSYPGIFVGAVYLLLGLFIYRIILLWRSHNFLLLKKTIASAFVSGITFILLTLVALVSILRLSEHINRGESLSFEAVLHGSLPWEAMTTFIFPFAGTSNMVMWETDWTLINCYLGIIPFLFLLFSFFQKNILAQSKWYLIGGVFFFAIAMGNDLPLRKWMYEIIPLMDIFRLSTYFRSIGIFCLLIASGFSIDYFFNKISQQYIYKYLLIASIVILSIALWAKNKGATINGGMMIERNGNWDLVPEAQFFNNIGTQGLLHFMLLFLLSIGLIFLKKKTFQKALLLFVVSLDLFFAVQLNIKSTVVHNFKTKEVTSIFDYHSPDEYPLPPINVPFKKLHRVANFDYVHLHVNLNHFHKIPSPDGASPVYFKWVAAAMEEGIYQKTIEYPLVFAAENINDNGMINETTIDTLSFQKIKIEKYTPNKMELTTNFSKSMELVFLQNYHPDWKAYINGEEKEVKICNKTFLSITIPDGNQKVEFAFEPKVEILSFYGSVVSWIAVGVFFITILFRRKKG